MGLKTATSRLGRGGSLGSLGAGEVALDPDAQAFLTAAVIATGTTQGTAINNLVVGIKATSGLWAKFTAIYPFVGGNASAHSYNLINPAAHQITWTGAGGFTHNANGVTGDGVGYGVTDIAANAGGFVNSLAFGAYSRNAITGPYSPLGASDGANYVILLPNYVGSFYSYNTGPLAATFSAGNDMKLFMSSRVSSASHVIYSNGVSLASTSAAQGTLPAFNFYIFADNVNGVATNQSLNNLALAFISTGLTSGDVTAFNTAVNTYQTTLGRNV